MVISVLIMIPLTLIICIVSVITQMGNITWVAIGIYILMIVIQTFATFSSRKVLLKTKKVTDARVKLMNEVLTGIRVIKYYCWEKPFKGKIGEIRDVELKLTKKLSWIMSLGFDCIMQLVPQIVPLVCFSLYPTVMKKPLTSSVAYTSFSLYDASNAFCYDSYGISCLCPIQCIYQSY